MIIAGALGSVITLLLTALLDLFKARYMAKLEMKKLLFQRKTDAVENAISCLHESVVCYRMMIVFKINFQLMDKLLLL